jgi:hypothetical protein
MAKHFALMVVIAALVSIAAASVARAQDTPEERELQQQQINGSANPLMAKGTRVSFSGNGSANFVPHNANGSLPGPTPAPDCVSKSTPVGFQVACLSNPENKSAATCNGSISFYALNETRSVSGQIDVAPNDVFEMTLHSEDGDIQGCQLGSVAPASDSLGNIVTMSGCSLSVAGCLGDVSGAGADHALTNSASITLTPAE